MPIQLLPPRLANQIAAGEVVERPASVVKELVENSLDAGANRIELDIEKGGHKRIKLRDNGSGIAKHELELALSRHATSKISTLDDLEQILSLGFRGEALASISAVSRLKLTSKPAAQEQAWQACCEGRDMAVQVQPAAHPDGTTIDVMDIFYNTPARRKFLRTEKTEYQHIEEVIKRIALSRPDVTFVLRHNGKVTKRFAGSNDLAVRVGQVCGQKFVQQAIHIQCDYASIKLEAWLGDARQLRSSNDCQYSFVNGRGMRDKLILHALRQAYDSVLGSAEQPAFVVYLTIDPREVDVNVHPAKHEVRFQQGRLVHDFICKTVCDALSESSDFAVDHDIQQDTGHDYIRPLSPVVRESHQDSQFQPASPSQSPTGFTGQSDQPNQSGPTSSHRAGVAGSAGSRGVSGRPYSAGSQQVSTGYQQHYQQLMTPTDEIVNSTVQAGGKGIAFLPLGESARLYADSDAEQCWLLSVNSLYQPWLAAILEGQLVAQPLLMPVSVSQAVNSAASAVLEEFAFELHCNAGKTRLLKVPAPLRQLPWAALFPKICEAQPDCVESLTNALANSLAAQAYQPDTLWRWFDQLAISSQSDILKACGAKKSHQALMQWIEKE